MYREIIKARLSEQARKIRRELGLSQERMSEELRITTRAYGDLERGKYCFSAFALLFLLRLSGQGGMLGNCAFSLRRSCGGEWSGSLSEGAKGDSR